MSIRTNGKSRQSAMKRYFKYAVYDGKVSNLYPYAQFRTDTVDGVMENFNVFFDGFSFVLTREELNPELKTFQSIKRDKDSYPTGVIDLILKSRSDTYNTTKVDVHKILEDSKELGYHFKLSECRNSQSFKYVWNYNNTYGKIGILDQAFKIIDDGTPAWIWNDGWNKPLILENSIGICCIMPIKYKPKEDHKIFRFKIVEE